MTAAVARPLRGTAGLVASEPCGASSRSGRLGSIVQMDGSAVVVGDGGADPAGSLAFPGSLVIGRSLPAQLTATGAPVPRGQAPPLAGDAELPGNDKILATTYVPERLPSQYLRRWRA